MSEEKSKQPEQSVEEILASIRRIISDDEERSPEIKSGGDRDAAAGTAEDRSRGDGEAAKVPPDPESDFADEILELTDRIDDEAAEASHAPAPAGHGIDESLVSAAAADAVTNAFAELSRAIDRRVQSVSDNPGGDENHLEELVKELVRPMLKEWLDENLPALVEQLVRKEIQRMVGRTQGL